MSQSNKALEEANNLSAIAQSAPHARRRPSAARRSRVAVQLKMRGRPLTPSPSPAPQLIAANSSTQRKAAMPHPDGVCSFRDKHVATPAVCARRSSHYASGNATPGTQLTPAAAVRPEPCLASWEPVFAGVMLRCAAEGCEHARERRQCGLQAGFKKNVAPSCGALLLDTRP